jgi:TfoX/Sxy family transcriptional regulator of competence genes
MAYDEWLVERIDQNLSARKVIFETKKMMGGLCYLVDGKMLLGLVRDQLMCRIGLDEYDAALQKEGVHEMTFTGRSMKGYVFVDQEVIDEDDELDYWVELCLVFNPLAKSSKKKA